MTSRVVASRYGRAALDALRSAVRAAKASDPMAPVTVLLPNNLAGVVARRHLATHGLTDEGPNAIAGEWGHNPLPWPRDDERPGPRC